MTNEEIAKKMVAALSEEWGDGDGILDDTKTTSRPLEKLTAAEVAINNTNTTTGVLKDDTI